MNTAPNTIEIDVHFADTTRTFIYNANPTVENIASQAQLIQNVFEFAGLTILPSDVHIFFRPR